MQFRTHGGTRHVVKPDSAREGFAARTTGARRGRKGRRLSLEPEFLEDRTLLTTPPSLMLSQLINDYDPKTALPTPSSLVTQGLGGVTVPLLEEGLNSILDTGTDLGGLLETPFQFLPSASDSTLMALTSDFNSVGLSVVYPQPGSTFPASPATSGPFAGDYLVVKWTTVNNPVFVPPSSVSNVQLANLSLADF